MIQFKCFMIFSFVVFGSNGFNIPNFNKIQKPKRFQPTLSMMDNQYIVNDLQNTQIKEKLENSIFQLQNKLPNENYGELLEKIDQNRIKEIILSQDLKLIISFDSENMIHKTQIHPILLPDVIKQAKEHHTDIKIINQENNIIPYLRFLFYIPFFFLGFNILSNLFSMNNGFPFNQRKNFMEPQFEKPNITLHDWAGSPEIFEECFEIVSYLKNNTQYKKIGAEIPKGLLLEGSPGTGKTLLAKAIAHETNANFISIVGSDFVELFVGMGASRVRKLFQDARKNKPCIIFIDEIDAIGRKRSSSNVPGNNEEREQTLNQLLAEMDGFSSNEDIIIIGATNRKDVLDQALLRPGRFDRIITVPLPDASSRESILKLYLNKYKSKDIILGPIVSLTSGFSGAELKNLLNEAAIIVARNGKEFITNTEIFEALEKIQIGIIKKNDTRDIETIERVAIHEVGHTLAVLTFPEYFNFEKTTIQGTYSGAGGYTVFLEKENIKDNGLYTKNMLIKRLMILLAGKAAENIFYGKEFVSLGAYQDLKEANQLALQMIKDFGMGSKLETYAETEYGVLSDFILNTIDRECLQLIHESFLKITKKLKKNIKQMEYLKDLLIQQKIVTKKDIQFDLLYEE